MSVLGGGGGMSTSSWGSTSAEASLPYGPALSALVSQFPEPRWDEETSQKAFQTLLRRLDRREAYRRYGLRLALIGGALGTAFGLGALLFR